MMFGVKSIFTIVAVVSPILSLVDAWVSSPTGGSVLRSNRSKRHPHRHERERNLLSSLSRGRRESPSLWLSIEDKELSDEYDLSLFSPCKVNLFLRILGKREDGFHDLASLFQTVAFGDMLHLTLLQEDVNAKKDDFTCNMRGVPSDKSNLVIRALDLVRSKTGNGDKFFKANLRKQVPAQAGLGGGSGNAAAAMWGANELLGRPASLEQLVQWSAELGSDITFFLSTGTAYCTGRGEIMTPVQPLQDGTKLTIVKPDIGLSTPAVFKALDYAQLSTIQPEELLDRFMEHGPIGAGNDAYVNDLEQPAFDCLPQLRALKKELCAVDGFDHVMMSGSGTSIFCIGEPNDRKGFMEVFGERKGLSVFSTEFISRQEGVWFQDKS